MDDSRRGAWIAGAHFGALAAFYITLVAAVGFGTIVSFWLVLYGGLIGLLLVVILIVSVQVVGVALVVAPALLGCALLFLLIYTIVRPLCERISRDFAAFTAVCVALGCTLLLCPFVSRGVGSVISYGVDCIERQFAPGSDTAAQKEQSDTAPNYSVWVGSFWCVIVLPYSLFAAGRLGGQIHQLARAGREK